MASLYDKLTRHQAYMEGVKAWKANDFEDTLDVINRRIGNIILDGPVENVGEMSAAQYRNFERRINRQLTSTLNRSKAVLLSDLQDMAAVDNKVLRSILTSENVTRRKMPTAKQLWSSILRKNMGVTGGTLTDLIDAYFLAVKRDTLQEVRKARTDNKTLRELFDIFKGTRDANFRNGLLRRFKNQSNTVISTSLQHITSVAQARYDTLFYERYRWVAVLDSVTTEICRSRDGKTWIYGKGPLPPAHYNCRSKIVPVQGSKRNLPSDYFEWLKEQPVAFLRDIVGIDKAKAIKEGKATKAEYPKFQDAKPLPITSFESKLSLILTD
jgi:SPP1 gp7 family putative phage head morphogenesis protein